MHKSYTSKRYTNESQSLTIDQLLTEFKDEMEFHRKVHLSRLSISEENEKIPYLTKVQDNLVSGLFGSNLIIRENYKKNFKPLILESVSDFSNQIRKFNDFLFESLVFDLNRYNKIVVEQNSPKKVPTQPVTLTPNTQPNYTPSQIAYTTNAGQTGTMKVKDVGPDLQKAVDYIKENGVESVFEGLRKALFSWAGAAAQFLLSITGVGGIVNEVIWGIMLLYDLYQLVNRKVGALANVVIDVICLLTAGNLGKHLSKLVGSSGKTIKSILQEFSKKGLGGVLTSIIASVEKGASSISRFLGEGAKFVEQRMGIKWLTGLVSTGKEWFAKFATEFKAVMTAGAQNLGSKLVRVGVQLGNKFEAGALTTLANKSEQELAQIAGEEINKAVLKSIEKESEERFVGKPTQEVLDYIDKQFGTKYGNLYAAYIGGKKLASAQSKIGGRIDVSDIGADLIRKKETLSKSEKESEKIQNALNSITG